LRRKFNQVGILLLHIGVEYSIVNNAMKIINLFLGEADNNIFENQLFADCLIRERRNTVKKLR